MNAHLVSLLVVDHDRIGAQAVRDELENANYGNDCIHPHAINVQTRDIGEWSDSHPLNRTSTAGAEVARLFGDTARRLEVAQRMADALRACWDLGIDSHLVSEVSAVLAEWETTR